MTIFLGRVFAPVCCGLGLSVLSATAQTNTPVTAKVVHVLGKARVSHDGQTWQKLKSGNELSPGSLLQTAENSSVDFSLSTTANKSPENFVRLYPNSVLQIEQLNSPAHAMDIELDLRSGEILGDTRQLPADARYEVKFPSGFLGARSGTYHLQYGGILDVMRGQFVLVTIGSDNASHTKVVNAGERFNSASGAVSAIPEDAFSKTDSAAKASAAITPTPAATTSALTNSPEFSGPRGTGMGGSLRKF